MLSFADAQVSISPLTDYTSRFRSTSFRKVLFLLVSNFVRQIWLPRIFSYKSQSSECMRFGSSGFISGQVSVHTGSGPQPISLHAVPMMRESFKHFIYSIRFAIPHQPIRRSPDRSVDPSVARSIARSIARSLGRSFGHSIGRSVTRSIVRSFTQSLSPPPSLPLPVSIPRFPHPFPCISPPFVKILSRSVHLPPCLSPSPYLVLPNLPFPEPPESPLLQGFIQSCPLRGGHAPSSAPNDSNNFLCIFSNETHFFRHRCLICGTFISADPFEHTS